MRLVDLVLPAYYTIRVGRFFEEFGATATDAAHDIFVGHVNHPGQLGTQNIIVQIDESLFRHKLKYHCVQVPASDQCGALCITVPTNMDSDVE